MMNAIDLARKIRNEIVVCVLLTENENRPLFLDKDGKFSENIDNVDMCKKEHLYEKVCHHPEWDNIQGRIVFWNGEEAKEYFN